MSTEDRVEFDYFISEKNEFLVVSFLGKIDNNCLDKLSNLKQEILSKEQVKFVVLNFRDSIDIVGEAIQAFTHFQKDIRAKPAELRVCGLNPNIKDKLIRLGLLRGNEIVDNLNVAIQSLAKKK